jgi:hypothetical protein
MATEQRAARTPRARRALPSNDTVRRAAPARTGSVCSSSAAAMSARSHARPRRATSTSSEPSSAWSRPREKELRDASEPGPSRIVAPVVGRLSSAGRQARNGHGNHRHQAPSAGIPCVNCSQLKMRANGTLERKCRHWGRNGRPIAMQKVVGSSPIIRLAGPGSAARRARGGGPRERARVRARHRCGRRA